MKKGIFILSILIIILFGFLAGLYVYKILSINEEQSNMEIANKERIEDECTEEYEHLENTIIANAQKEKISPNANIIKKVYYEECGHTSESSEIVDKNYINLTEDEFSLEHKDWEIEKFSKDEVILKRTEDGTCDEHYIVKAKDGYVAVYSIDDKENETIIDTTDIGIQFLPITDSEKLKTGIRVYGKDNLNRLLEDFE